MVEMTETRLCRRNEINKKKPEEQPASRNGEKKTEIYERETKKAGLERRQEGIREKRGWKRESQRKEKKKGGYLDGGRSNVPRFSLSLSLSLSLSSSLTLSSLSFSFSCERKLESRGTRIRQIEVYPSCESSQVGGGEGFLEEIERRCKSE